METCPTIFPLITILLDQIVKSVPKALTLNISPPDGSPERQALKFGNQKINLHDAQAPYIPHAKTPIPGSLDLCFLSVVSVQHWITVFAKHKISIENGPVQKTGATGPLMSVYVRDPDGNLIEISNQL